MTPGSLPRGAAFCLVVTEDVTALHVFSLGHVLRVLRVRFLSAVALDPMRMSHCSAVQLWLSGIALGFGIPE